MERSTATVPAIQVEKVYKRDSNTRLSDCMSTRMTKCAAMLEQGEYIAWQMDVPKKGKVGIFLFGSPSLSKGDLKWVCEKTGKCAGTNHLGKGVYDLTELYEFFLPIADADKNSRSIGFGACCAGKPDPSERWPSYLSTQFPELVRMLQQTGASYRVTLGAATEREKEDCRKAISRSFHSSNLSIDEYVGIPVKMKVLLRLPSSPTVRLKTVLTEAVPGAKLRYIGSMNSMEVAEVWDNPLSHSVTLPDYAARILMIEPTVAETMIGIDVCEESTKLIPATHKNTTQKRAVLIGQALDTATGAKRKITIGELDLKRHYQIVGQTGTGKSTLLSTMILSAIEQGHGLTFFDPHGSTIDVVLKSLPEKSAHKVRVVRIGDTDHPVPLNIWDSDDPVKEERNISDLCELFSDIFDPQKQGIVGPRYERWLSTFAKASIALLGRRASLESIAVISQSKDNMLKAYKAIVKDYPELAETIKQEYGTDNSNDFQNILNWYLCKFQRLTAVEQLRQTLGAGTNALDFNNSIDTDTVTLIDLASPTIGSHAARIVGTLLLMKLWNAAMKRKQREKTHMVFVDEASLFQTNPMPRMLAESRKFGISMVLCHQHAGQLTAEIRDALESNSANFTAFRLSPRDAISAAVRFDDPTMQVSLTRLPAFHAITSLSVDGSQTEPFTLTIQKPKFLKDGSCIAALIEKNSIASLVTPYSHLRALTSGEILAVLNGNKPPVLREQPPEVEEDDSFCLPVDDNEDSTMVFEASDDEKQYSSQVPIATLISPNNTEEPDWLSSWRAYKGAIANVGYPPIPSQDLAG